MADRIKKIKIKQADGSFSDYMPIGADAWNIDFNNGYSLEQVMGEINPDEEGTVATQLKKLSPFYIDVSKYDIIGDVSDVSAKFQALVNSKGSATYFFPNGEYLIHDISLPSNTTILGDTDTLFAIRTYWKVNIFSLLNVENIAIKNLKFTHANTGDLEKENLAPQGWDIYSCIKMEGCNNIFVENCHFKYFWYGITIINTSHITIRDCSFIESGYSMILCLNDSHYILIDNCYFDHCYNNNTGNTYMVVLSANPYSTDTCVSHATIRNCEFRNNPIWEGVECHRGHHLTVVNNRFFNVNNTIVFFNDNRFTNGNIPVSNVIIDGNYIDASNNANFYRLIYVAGDLNNKLLGENVSIINNIIENSDSTYGIYVDRIRNIDNNKITANSGQLFRLRNVIDGQFNNNNCHLQNETAGSFFGQIDLAHRISVCNNTFTSWQPMTFTIYHATGDTGCSNVFFYNNQAKWTEAFLRNWTRYGLYSTYGQYFPDFAGDMLPKQRPLDLGTVARYGASGREITDVAFAGTAGSNILTTSTDILPYFTINQTVQLKGAGTDGANLECVITDYIDSSHIKISTPVITSVSGVLMFCPPTLAMEELRPTS